MKSDVPKETKPAWNIPVLGSTWMIPAAKLGVLVQFFQRVGVD